MKHDHDKGHHTTWIFIGFSKLKEEKKFKTAFYFFIYDPL